MISWPNVPEVRSDRAFIGNGKGYTSAAVYAESSNRKRGLSEEASVTESCKVEAGEPGVLTSVEKQELKKRGVFAESPQLLEELSAAMAQRAAAKGELGQKRRGGKHKVGSFT